MLELTLGVYIDRFWNLLMGAMDNNSTIVKVARRGIARSWDIISKERAGIW
jgi:hypothetical protein